LAAGRAEGGANPVGGLAGATRAAEAANGLPQNLQYLAVVFTVCPQLLQITVAMEAHLPFLYLIPS
jgi:hypothetical protein